jgi:hypothetical protein
MNAIVPESHVALESASWLQRATNALREWATAPSPATLAAPLPFANVDEVLRKAHAERSACVRRGFR